MVNSSNVARTQPSRQTLAGPSPTRKAPPREFAGPLEHASAIVSRPGQALDTGTRVFMEASLGHDFSSIRTHSDTEAAASTRELDAAAYTVGHHIVFANGIPNVRTRSGKALLAHELAHTIQQGPNESRVQPLTLGPTKDPLEQEADASARSVMHGDATKVRIGRASGAARRIQRAEYGTYISTLTEVELKPFLDNAVVYYKGWNYPNVKRVSAMDQVLDDLGKAKNHIDKFRLVSHAAPLAMELGLTSAISKEEIGKKEMGLTTPEKFRPLFTGNKVVNDTSYAREMKILRADATTGPLLTQLGVGQTDPGNNDPLGILLRAIFDSDLVSSATLDTGAPAIFKNRVALNAFNTQRIQQYRAVVESAVPAAQSAAVKKAITELIAAAPAALRKGNVDWSFTQAEADDVGKDLVDPNKKTPALKPELSAAITEGTGKGSFLPKLDKARRNIDKGTHIEIRGCNAGRDKSFLESVRAFFAPSSAELPSISAPDLFQAFFSLGFETYDSTVPADKKRLQDSWDDKTTGLADAYDDAYRTRNSEMIRVVSDSKLSDLIARYKLSQTEQDLRLLNPELKSNELRPGQLVWLVGRQLPAGLNPKLEDFCQNVLGDKNLWPTIWSYNPQWIKPPALQPNDMVWVVPPAQRKRVASTSRSLADFEAELQKGQAFGTVDPSNQFKLHMDHRQRAASVGAWVNKQGYDSSGRTPAQLSKTFGGDFKKAFMPAMSGHAGQLLTRSFPTVEDPIFPDDPRYAGHIVRLP